MRYHNITRDDMLNGDGLRVVLWVSGCDHCCEGCHNPVTWDPQGGLPFSETEKEEIFSELRKPYIDGITFSGGDPLHPSNIDGIASLSKEIKKAFPQKTIWLYTGSIFEDIKNLPLLKYIDVLIDGKFIQEKLDPKLHWRGTSNQRVIDVKQTLDAGEIILYTK